MSKEPNQIKRHFLHTILIKFLCVILFLNEFLTYEWIEYVAHYIWNCIGDLS